MLLKKVAFTSIVEVEMGSVEKKQQKTQQNSSNKVKCHCLQVERVDPAVEFTRYMGYLLPTSTFTQLLSSSKSGAVPRSPFTGSIICDSQLYWLNGLIGRCFFDFLRDAWWANKVKDKLQRKLSKIHVSCYKIQGAITFPRSPDKVFLGQLILTADYVLVCAELLRKI